jgi:hypothetical protein
MEQLDYYRELPPDPIEAPTMKFPRVRFTMRGIMVAAVVVLGLQASVAAQQVNF